MHAVGGHCAFWPAFFFPVLKASDVSAIP